MQLAHTSLKKTARIAGLLYLAGGLFTPFSIVYVPKQIITPGDSAATFNHLLDNEFLFRTGILSSLISSVLLLVLALVLYRLFRQVSGFLSKLLVAFVIVQVPIIFISEVFNISALMVAKNELLSSFDLVQRQHFATLFLSMHNFGITVVEMFWGLWLLPYGILVYRSGFIPRVLGILLIIGGIGYTIDSCTFVLFPAYREFTRLAAFGFSALAELPIMLWLLIKGVKGTGEV
jgi:hypothetical protein